MRQRLIQHSKCHGRFAILGLLLLVAFFSARARERVLMDAGWRFQLGDPADVTTNVTVYPEIPDLAKLEDSGGNAEFIGAKSETNLMALRPDPVATHAGENVSYVTNGFDDRAWRALDLPHDWAVELPFDQTADGGHGYKPVGYSSAATYNIGWYRHTFTLPASDAGKTMWLELDGIYRNALIWLNGRCLGRDVSGYASISFDVTTNLIAGGTNVLVVRVDASRFEGWFYEGAGIYRHVWLVKTAPVHVAPWGTYIATTAIAGSNATITLQTTATNQSSLPTVNASLTSAIMDANSNVVIALATNLALGAYQGLIVTQAVTVPVNLWSPQTPYLYNLSSTISNQNSLADVYNTPFGVRTVRFDPTNGVFINGQHVEIQGVCNHQDHAGVGSALPDRLQYFRIERLKQMGVNACRTSHNAPTPEFLDACDQLGMLVLDENRRVGTDPETLGQLQRQILRDRNHPGVFCWSLGNEEDWVQGDTNGTTVLTMMQKLAHSLDATRLCTVAINGSFGATGFMPVIDVKGFNYSLSGIDSYHSSNPGSNYIGTETASTVTTRGIYTNDTINGYVSAYDLITTTGLPNPVTWGETAEVWWQFCAARPWSSGGFCWTGFDYRGEPTPYNWPCINSHFGIMDTCGFPKDNFYYYQANWSPKPVLHLLPHWNWPAAGQPITVWAYGNCQVAELFLNGVSQGRQTLQVQGHVSWNVPYAAGTLQAIGYNNTVPVITNTVVSTGVPAAITLIPDRAAILADGRDVSVVTVAVVDAQGRVVPTATNEISFSITGGGAILGVGNGNPSSHEADKGSQRAVFNGLAEIIIQSTNQPGTIALAAVSTGLSPANTAIAAAAVLPAPAPPTGVAALPGNSRVFISWDIVPGAVTYNVKRSTVSGGPYTNLISNVGSLGFTDGSVSNFTTYYYVVSANGSGEGSNSLEAGSLPTPIVSSVTATAANGQIFINWAGSPGAAYNLKRSTATGGPYAAIAEATTATNYTDTSVATCQTYYYVVTITNAANESLPSAEASAEVPGALPPFFTSYDIGAVGLAGSATYCGGQYTISGSGADIWNNADAFQFVYAYVPVTTNCDLRARVASVQNTSSNAKAAVMIRETLDPASRHALVDVEPGAGIEFLFRTNTGGSTYVASVAGQTAPNWVRLTRTNNIFQAYWSPDGVAWSQIGAATNIPMTNASAYVGLAVCAHNNAVLNTSVLDNLSANFLPINTPPRLAPMANQTVNVGQPVLVTASATDTNFASQPLGFSLVAAPASASLTQINPTNASFSWRPTVTNAATTNLVALMVADHGSPSLSATQSFLVTVNFLPQPGVPAITISNGLASLRVSNSLVGPDYAVLGSTNLLAWNTLFITNSPPTSSFEWTDTNALASPARFYRIKAGPPLP
jgi:beta-galactosidase